MVHRVKPRFNEPLYNEVLGMTNDFLYPSNSEIYEKEPGHNKTSLWRTCFASQLALPYIEVPLCLLFSYCFLLFSSGWQPSHYDGFL